MITSMAFGSTTLRRLALPTLLAAHAVGCSSASDDTPRQVADAFFAALQAENSEAAFALLTEDAMLHAPYNPNGDASDAGIRSFPARFYVAGAMQTYDNLVWEDREYSVADDGRTVWIEAEGKLKVAETGRDYHNRYVFKLDLVDGKIDRIVEYTNVATLARDGVTASAR